MANKKRRKTLGKRGMSLFLAVLMLFGMLQSTALAAGTPANQQQVVDAGGSKSDKHVTVSKTLEGTDKENYFDITLTVKTTTSAEQIINTLDTDVVIVMDISNTMNSEGRYAAAVSAAKKFIEDLQTAAKGLPTGVDLRVGFVAFNTDGHKIMNLKEVSKVKFKADIQNNTDKIIGGTGYASNGTRFTNIEGGLQAAQDMFKNSATRDKKIVFISDGFPTTWSKDNGSTKGVVPIDHKGLMNAYGGGKVSQGYWEGTNYSETGARQAAAKAAELHRAGVDIYPVGIVLGNQTIKGYVNARPDLVEIPSGWNKKWSFNDSSKDGFTTWLKNSIGNVKQYWGASNASDLGKVFKEILDDIDEKVTDVQASWVANDPMGSVGGVAIDFMGFYNKDGKYTGAQKLTGSWAENAEDTADVKTVSGVETIRWNLLSSGYTTKKENNVTTYTYSVKYRVRLANEIAAS